MGAKTNGCGVFGFILSLLAVGLFAASVGTSHWQRPPGNNLASINADRHQGLYETCATVGSQKVCTLITWDPRIVSSTLTTVRVILLIAGIIMVIGLLFGLAAVCGSGNIAIQGGFNIVSALFVWVGCACYIAMTVFVEKSVNNPPGVEEYGYSHYLCWVSGLLLMLAGICCVNGKNENRNMVQPATVQAQMVWATRTQPQVAVISQRGQHPMALAHA